jgi:hypothetical protein
LGDPDAPLSDETLGAKFIESSRPALGAAGAASLLAQLSTGGALP